MINYLKNIAKYHVETHNSFFLSRLKCRQNFLKCPLKLASFAVEHIWNLLTITALCPNSQGHGCGQKHKKTISKGIILCRSYTDNFLAAAPINIMLNSRYKKIEFKEKIIAFSR
jgi:hypothetical protein